MLPVRHHSGIGNYRKALLLLFQILYVFCFLSAFPALAHRGEKLPITTSPQHTGISFIENKGQWNDTIRYKAEIGNGVLFLTDQGFVYHFTHEDDLKAYHDQLHNKQQDQRTQFKPLPEPGNQIFRHHAYKVNFVGARQGPKIFKGEAKRSWYNNYFIGNDSSKWQSKVGLYGKVIQEDVYAGIDMAIYQNGQSLKYDFIVSPGADPSQIRLEFEGVLPKISENGDLIIETSVNTILEQAPIVYQEVNGKKQIIPSRFKLTDNYLSYELLGDYNQVYPLIIDPTLVFASYSGSTGYQKLAYTSTYDREGNFYLGAQVFLAFPNANGSYGWPTTIGAFQTTASASAGIANSNTTSIGINKYNADGSTLLWSTYLDGNGDETPRSLIVNEAGELVIAATTNSTDMPTLPSSHDPTFKLEHRVLYGDSGLITIDNYSDIFLAKLNSTGSTLLASTYYGTVFSEYGYLYEDVSPIEIAIGENNSVWIISNTPVNRSYLPIPDSLSPITDNAFQPIPGGGSFDVLLGHFDSNLSNLLFCSYFGGSGFDIGKSIHMGSNGNLIICGLTESQDLPTTQGVLHPNYLGDRDGFVAAVDTQNYQILHSTYIGTNKADDAVRIQTDEQGNIIVVGNTFGDYPISPNVFNIDDGDVFIDKISTDLSNSMLSTRLGRSQADTTYVSVHGVQTRKFNVYSFLYDRCGRSYISGYLWTRTAVDMPTTPNRLQTNRNNEVFWMGILDPDFADLHFGTYYGTDHDHPHPGITRYDPYGRIYQFICSSSDNYPTTTNGAFPNKQNSGVDAIAFKIDLEAEFVEAVSALQVGISDTGCAPYTVMFQNNTYCPFPVEYAWDFGDGSPIDTSANPTHTFSDSGVYQVVLKAYSPLTCNVEDYDTIMVTVLSSEEPDIFTQDTAVCSKTDRVQLWVGINNPSPDMYIKWLPSDAIVGPDNTDTVTVLPSESLIYTVKVGYQSNGCAVATRQIHIDYAPRELELLNGDTILCKGDTLAIEAVGSEGYTYRWSPTIGISDTLALEPYIIATETHTYILTAIHPKCDDTSQSFVLTVDTPNLSDFVVKPKEVCVGQPAYLYPSPSDHSATGLRWSFDHSVRREGQIGHQYQHAFDQPGTHPITLSMQFRACPLSEYTDSIMVYPLPEVELGGDSSICLHGAPVYLKNLREAPLNPYHYLWNTGDTTAVLKVVHPGIYTLSVTSESLGCTTTESIEIKKDCYIDMPNAFSPNGDGYNDYFFPRQLLSESVSKFKMQVFNRWGQLIFETSNPEGRGWDGRFNDQAQPVGVYLYRIEVDFRENRRQEQYEGNVTLIR